MKKLTFKAFTLVEMLIVIVIIGILIAALLPRLQGAQGMARDTARQTALSQLQAAIVTYQSLNGRRPGSGETTDSPTTALNTNSMTKLVTSNIMSELPVDPNLDNTRTGFGMEITWGWYAYIVLMKNTVNKAWFVLMAKTEIPGKSNWVQKESCGTDGTENPSGTNTCIGTNTDMKNISICKTMTENTTVNSAKTGSGADQNCIYENPGQLYYIVTY